MKRILVIGMLLVVVSTLDAAPRGRRARRRARQASSQTNVRNYSSTNYYRSTASTPSSSTQQQRYSATNYQPSYATNSVPVAPRVSTPAPGALTTSYITPTTYRAAAPSAPVSSMQLARPTTAYKPIVSDVPPAPVVLAMADSLPNVEPTTSSATTIPVEPATNQVVQAAALQPIPDPLTSLKDGGSLTQPAPYCASCTVIPAGKSFNSALAELNGIRARKGLPALVEDASLSALAHQKASIQANRGVMYHPGGSMGKARFEGVGVGPRFTTCYQDATNVTYAGAATVVGRNGQRYHCLLVR